MQELNKHDYVKRIECCQNILHIVLVDAVLILGSKVHFYLSGCVNKQNLKYWTEIEPLHSQRVTIWFSVFKFEVTGPHVLEEEGKQ